MKGRLQSVLRGLGKPVAGTVRAAFSGPADTRLYAVGDVHGRLDLLTALHRLIEKDAAASRTSRKVLIYLGDYIDRGPDSRGVLEAVGRGLDGFDCVRLAGNHDREMVAALDGTRSVDDWLRFGGIATLQSYGIPLERLSDKPGAIQRLLQEMVPAEHQALLHDLSLWHREGDLLFVHAGIRPGLTLEEQHPEDLVWIREPFLHSREDYGFLVIHGHTIVSAPEVRPNRIGIDTGAFASGRLTCLVIEGEALSFLNT